MPSPYVMQALSSHSLLCESKNFRPSKQLFPKLPEPGLVNSIVSIIMKRYLNSPSDITFRSINKDLLQISDPDKKVRTEPDLTTFPDF